MADDFQLKYVGLVAMIIGGAVFGLAFVGLVFNFG